MNPNWQRWIHASLCDYVKRELTALGVVVHFEGQGRELLVDVVDYAEFRWNGPIAREVSRGYWEIEIEVNFVATSGSNRADAFAHKTLVGKIQSILRNSISVFKFGTGEADTQQLLGCLQLKITGREAITTNYFGRIADPVEIEESTIEATYCMYGP